MVARADALTITQPYGIGRGTVEAFTVATPAAGSNFTRTTAQGYWERVICLTFVFTTSAAVANRVMAVNVLDADNNPLGGSAASNVQQASAGVRWYVAPALDGPIGVAVQRASMAFPYVFLQPGWKLQADVGAIDAADAFTLIRGVVERFGIGPDGTPVGETEMPYTERGRGYARALESE